MEITKILKCDCGYSTFLKKGGGLQCKNCKKYYPVKNGIYDFLDEPSVTIQKELKENLELQKQRRNKTDEWLLKLPLAENFGNTKFPKVNEGYLENVSWVLNNFDIKGKTVLDIGAGTCWTTNLLAKKGAECIALDISSEKFIGLESAEVYFRHNKVFFERVLSDMDNLPFAGNSFDVVFANAALHHARDIKKTLKEVSKVLKPGGIFIAVNEPCSGILNRSKRINIKKAREIGMDVQAGWNEKIYSLRDYKKALKQNRLLPKFVIPPSLELLLHNLNAVVPYKRLLGKILLYFWGRSFAKILYLAGAFIFGAPMIITSTKT